MASVDSAKFSAIFTQVESLHELGMDQLLPRGGAIFKFCSANFPLIGRGVVSNVWLSARSYAYFSRVCGGDF
jgi:hypothetical protein